jgi:hypothetical protein
MNHEIELTFMIGRDQLFHITTTPGARDLRLLTIYHSFLEPLIRTAPMKHPSCADMAISSLDTIIHKKWNLSPMVGRLIFENCQGHLGPPPHDYQGLFDQLGWRAIINSWAWARTCLERTQKPEALSVSDQVLAGICIRLMETIQLIALMEHFSETIEWRMSNKPLETDYMDLLETTLRGNHPRLTSLATEIKNRMDPS